MEDQEDIPMDYSDKLIFSVSREEVEEKLIDYSDTIILSVSLDVGVMSIDS